MRDLLAEWSVPPSGKCSFEMIEESEERFSVKERIWRRVFLLKFAFSCGSFQDHYRYVSGHTKLEDDADESGMFTPVSGMCEAGFASLNKSVGPASLVLMQRSAC